MRADVSISGDPTQAAASGRWAEDAGFDCLWFSETRHDPLLGCGLAAAETAQLRIGTAVAIAFARSPMNLAYTAWGVHLLAGGRFTLGLGTQVRAHIERRFAMEWSSPVKRMREYVAALRAIWTSWQEDAPLCFEGDYYTHTLMTPYFVPQRSEHGLPQVFMAAVGAEMLDCAATVADGVQLHPLVSELVVRDIVVPAIADATSRAARRAADVTLCVPVTVVWGDDDARLEAAIDRARRQIAFYAATPAYRPVLEAHGWGTLQPELQDLARAQRWDVMPKLIDDGVLDAFAVIGDPPSAAATLKHRFADVADRVTLLDVAASREVLGEVAQLVNGRTAA